MKVFLFMLVVFALLLVACKGQENVTIRFLDGTSATCSKVMVGDEFTTCLHESTFSTDSSEKFRNDSIEEIDQEGR